VIQGNLNTNILGKLSGSSVMMSLKELVAIPSIRTQIMQLLGLKTNDKDQGKPCNLKVDLSQFVSKPIIHVPLNELLKIPSLFNQATQFLGIKPKIKAVEKSAIKKDPPIMIQSVTSNGSGHPPFYIALEINQLILHNCMLDLGAKVNVMPLRVMEQLELKPSRQFNNICGMDARPVELKGIIENLNMRLVAYLEIEINMNVLVLDIPDTWGMFCLENGPLS